MFTQATQNTHIVNKAIYRCFKVWARKLSAVDLSFSVSFINDWKWLAAWDSLLCSNKVECRYSISLVVWSSGIPALSSSDSVLTSRWECLRRTENALHATLSNCLKSSPSLPPITNANVDVKTKGTLSRFMLRPNTSKYLTFPRKCPKSMWK